MAERLAEVAETVPAPPDGLSYAERLREAASWNLLMTRLEIEAARLRALRR